MHRERARRADLHEVRGGTDRPGLPSRDRLPGAACEWRGPRRRTLRAMRHRPHRPRPHRAWRALPLLALLLCATLWSGGPASSEGPEGDEPSDAVVLPGGERLACRVVEERAGFVTIEMHGRTYRLERARLEAVERDGEPAVDPVLAAAVLRWAGDAASEHPAVRRGALAALGTLGTADLPALRSAGKQLDPAAAAVLDDLATTLEARALRSGEDEAVERALEAIGLSPDRAPLVARVARAYLFRVARGGSPEGALQELRGRLEPLLDVDDLETVVEALTTAPDR